MDSEHGVLPQPVATWFLPVNPLMYAHLLSAWLLAYLLLFAVCVFAFPLFRLFLLSYYRSVEVVFITGTVDQHF